MPKSDYQTARDYRLIRTALDLVTAPPSEKPVLEAVARPEALETSERIRSVIDQPNLVAVGIAEKQTRGRRVGQLALTFYVERKRKRPSSDEAVPEVVPAHMVGAEVPTDVVEIGKIIPEVQSQPTPIEPGFSIGHPAVSAGTLGAVIGPAKKPRVISNSHVLANSGLGKIGDPILYPGSADQGVPPADIVGELSFVVPFILGGEFVNSMDVAVATINPARRGDVRSRIGALGIVPSGTTLPARGMRIVKVGRTTGLTHGEITDINFTLTLDYGGGRNVGFRQQVFCTRYSAPGDSGSLVLEEGTNLAVGLHFAGANGGSVFSPIRPILRAVHGRLLGRVIGEPA
jgi:hypothetical protein